jgi:hypothetical protein
MRSGQIEGNIGVSDNPIVKAKNADPGSAGKRNVDPVVKRWLTNVLVPAMVKQYVSGIDQRENDGVTATGERIQ